MAGEHQTPIGSDIASPGHEPVRTIRDLRSLDEGDVLEGYLDGVSGGPAPTPDRTRGYWHGWRRGQVDSDRAQPDLAHVILDAALATLPR